MTTTHTCPVCATTLHTSTALAAWVTTDGRVIVEAHAAKPTEKRWLELPAGAQNWLAEIFRVAHETQQTQRRTDGAKSTQEITPS